MSTLTPLHPPTTILIPVSDSAPDLTASRRRGHRNSHSVGSTAITQPQMSGKKLHPALRDKSTGRHILSGKHRDPAYCEDVATLEDSSVEARDVQGKLLAMVAWADGDGDLDEWERRELASNVQFLINKEVGETPAQEHISLALVHEGERWFRIDAKVRGETIVEGRVETGQKRALRGLKRSVDDRVYGVRREYMG